MLTNVIDKVFTLTFGWNTALIFG